MSSYGYAGGGGPTAPPYQQGQQSWQSSGYGQPPSYGQPAAGRYGQTQPAPGGYGAPGYGQPPQSYSYGQSYQPDYQSSYPPQSSYGPPGGARFPPGTDPEVITIFQRADADGSGTIDANELGRLLSTGRTAFSPRTVRLMLHLFADNRNDTSRIGPAGFAKLWKEIKEWSIKFNQYDRDRSGTIDVNELYDVLLSFNFAIPQSVLQMLVSKYDTTGGSRSIGYDNFVECGFIVKGLTEKFRDQDHQRTGSATFDYTSFMLMVIPYIVA